MRIQIAVSVNTEQGQSLPILEGGKLVLKANVDGADHQQSFPILADGQVEGKWDALDAASKRDTLEMNAELLDESLEKALKTKFIASRNGERWMGEISFIQSETKVKDDPADDPTDDHEPKDPHAAHSQCEISGTVLSSDKYGHSPFAGLIAAIYARAPGLDDKIAEFPLDADGGFAGKVQTSGHQQLQIRLFAGGAKTALVESVVKRCKNRRVSFSLTLPAPKGFLFEQLASDLEAISEIPGDIVERQLVFGLTESNEADVLRYFNALRMAKELSARPKKTITPEIIFALLQRSPSANLNDLLLQSQGAFQSQIRNAIKERQIRSPGNAEVQRELVQTLVQARNARHLAFKPEAVHYGHLIKALGFTRAKQAALFAYRLESGGFEGYDDAISLSDANKNKLDTLLKIDSACFQYSPISALFWSVASGSVQSWLSDALDRTAQNWAEDSLALTEQGYEGAPSEFLSEKDTASVFGAAIAARLQSDNAGAGFALRVQETTIAPLKALASKLSTVPDFDPSQDSVDVFFKGDETFTSEELQTLKIAQRLYKVAGTGDERFIRIEALWNSGVASAQDIISLGKIEFIALLTSKGLSDEEALRLYCRARNMVAQTTEITTQLAAVGVSDKSQFANFTVDGDATGGSLATSEPASAPNLETLFGPMDSCACRDCHSVHSFPAYKHNLLHWMHSDVRGAWNTLKGRRPDIAKLSLSCENAHTVLPYIDLVNEALCLNLMGDDTTIFNTGWSEDRLRVQPEHRVEKAELEIASTNSNVRAFPLALPFDRSRLEGETAIEVAGLDYAALLSVFHASVPDTLDTVKVQRDIQARLGLSPWVYSFVLRSDFTTFPWQSLTGVSASPGRNVQGVMDALDLSFDALSEVLSLDYVKRDETGTLIFDYAGLTFTDGSCSYSDAVFTALDSGVGSGDFDGRIAGRALQLLRLSKCTGYDLKTLDQWISVFNTYRSEPNWVSIHVLQFLSQGRAINDVNGVTHDAQLAYFIAHETQATPEDEAALLASIFFDKSADTVNRALADMGLALNYGSAPSVNLKNILENLRAYFAVFETAPIIHLDDLHATLFDAAKTGLIEADANSDVELDDVTIKSAILGGMAKAIGVTSAEVLTLYQHRADNWAVWTPDNLPASASLGFKKFSDALWLQRRLAATKLPADIQAVIFDRLGALPLSDATHKTIAEFGVFVVGNQLPVKTFVAVLDDNFLAADAPDLEPYWNMIIPSDPISDLDHLDLALRLQDAVTALNCDLALLKKIFLDPLNPDWTGAATSTDHYNLAAELFSGLNTGSETREEEMIAGASAIRKGFRDALVACHTPNDSENSRLEDIYKFLLFDPGMQPCMLTSRMKLAVGSLQLLMHRAMLGLEADIFPDPDDKEQWKWRDTYRVWEANVKVFLYPENWLDPSLRLRVTPQFEKAVSAISQDELTDEYAEKIVHDYLSGMDKVNNLDIRAFYEDKTTVPSTLHMFGRTQNAPYEHYYRRRADTGLWDHWEKIEIDIEGDHLIPVIYHRRLWLFWPIFNESENKHVKDQTEFSDGNAPVLDVRMAYSRYEFGKWQGKKLLDPVLRAGRFTGDLYPIEDPHADVSERIKSSRRWKLHHSNVDVPGYRYPTEEDRFNGKVQNVNLEPSEFFFWTEIDDENKLKIRVARSPKDYEKYKSHYGFMFPEDSFVISGCNGPAGLEPPFIHPGEGFREINAVHLRPRLSQGDSQQLVRQHDDWSPHIYIRQSHLSTITDPALILGNRPDFDVLTYPQGKHAKGGAPFFLADSKRVHLFEREEDCRAGVFNGIELHWGIPAEKFDISPVHHPYTCEMISNLNTEGVVALFGRTARSKSFFQQRPIEKYFVDDYAPQFALLNTPYPWEEFDFSPISFTSAYNWELFFHLPTMFARQLKTDGRFEEAIWWLQMIFDPTNQNLSQGPRRFWGVKPLAEETAPGSIAKLLALLSSTPADHAQRKMRQALDAQITSWMQNPFEPDEIAKNRMTTYMMWCVLEYVDVLIEWADSLFRQDTMETINEATNLYMLANEILGRRLDQVDAGQRGEDKSFQQLLDGDEDTDILWTTELENALIGSGQAIDCRSDGCRPSLISSILGNGYFCIPPNPRLPEYWDRIEDRLFKIRHCRNIDGVERVLALFQPPIDPALLVRARAAGLDIGEVLAANAQALPYRFSVLLQKAQDYTAEVKGLGGQLLSAIEKRDSEELTQIRQVQEMNIQKMTRNLKLMNLAESKENLAALKHSLNSAQISHDFYDGREYMNGKEKTSLLLTSASDAFMLQEQTMQMVAGVLRIIPELHAGVVTQLQTGGDAIAGVASVIAQSFGVQGSMLRSAAGAASTLGSYDRRQEDWDFQVKTGAERIKELERQIIASEIRLQTAEKDIEIFDSQVENSVEIYDYMRSKFSGEKLYSWMIGELKKTHRQSFRLASDMARQVEIAYRRELGEDAGIIQADQWDASRAGLLAGETLSLQLKQLDQAYLVRKGELQEYELSRSVSLRRLNPIALWTLKTSGSGKVDFDLPKWLFQEVYDDVSLKAMRIKSVAVSLPCTVGPNVKVPLKLRLKSSDIYWDGITPTTYSGPEAKEIITSTAMNDAGRFEPSLNSLIYQPFENSGVKSSWSAELPKNLEFDRTTITDLVLHIRYTARPHATEAEDPLDKPKGSFPVSLRYDLRDEWLDLAKAIRQLDNSKTVSARFESADIGHVIPYVYRGGAAPSRDGPIFYVDNAGKLLPPPSFADLIEQGGEIGLETGGVFQPLKDIIFICNVP